MGLFANLHWSDGAWTTDRQPGEHRLSITIHDSDIAVIGFQPASGGEGVFFLGFEPAIYFEDPTASEPVDHDGEAKAFAKWARAATNTKTTTKAVRALMADDSGADPDEPFVEETVKRLLALAGVREPDWHSIP